MHKKQALEYEGESIRRDCVFVDLSVDGGPIILQDSCKVMEDDTVATLSDRILESEHRILPET